MTHSKKMLLEKIVDLNYVITDEERKEILSLSYYDLFDLDGKLTDAEIKIKLGSQYKKLSIFLHPDKIAENKEDKIARTEIFKHLNSAKEVLLDSEKRKEYDATLIQAVNPFGPQCFTKKSNIPPSLSKTRGQEDGSLAQQGHALFMARKAEQSKVERIIKAFVIIDCTKEEVDEQCDRLIRLYHNKEELGWKCTGLNIEREEPTLFTHYTKTTRCSSGRTVIFFSNGEGLASYTDFTSNYKKSFFEKLIPSGTRKSFIEILAEQQKNEIRSSASFFSCLR